MQPDLPPTYYLDNVVTLFDHVSRVYADILDPELRDFLDAFSALGSDARKLHIRLLNRSHDYYRRSKLNYPEIDNLANAIDELAAAGCIAVDEDIDDDQLLSLFTKSELQATGPEIAGLDRLRRDELEQTLLEAGGQAFLQALQQQDQLLHLLQRDQYSRCQMLFFGNLNQSMTDFVLRDLGLYQFESYSIDSQHRPYRSRQDIEQHWLLYQLEALFLDAPIEDTALLSELAAALSGEIDRDAPAFRKCQQLRYEIARQLERCDELDAALALYRDCQIPPARERIARILARQQDPDAALGQCRRIMAQPIDDSEIQFAAAFAARLARRHALELPAEIVAAQTSHEPEIVELELAYQASVELAVAEYYDAADNAETCFYLENSLFNGVLGLLLWEIVFAPVSGAFYNPFQYRPSDFYAPDFCTRRVSMLDDLWAEIESNDDIWRRVSLRWQQKHGLMNPLVHWQALDLDLIALALERIEHRHWRAIFDRILADLRNNRAGFPDLIHFPPQGGYCLIEVKGPGDSLQKNQQRWMQYFAAHDIPHRVARVTWRST